MVTVAAGAAAGIARDGDAAAGSANAPGGFDGGGLSRATANSGGSGIVIAAAVISQRGTSRGFSVARH
jgi:hypothetical protein